MVGGMQLNLTQINVPTIVAVLGVGAGIVGYASGIKADAVELRTRLEQLEQYRVSRSQTTDRHFDNVQEELAKLANVPHRMSVVENQVVVVNARIDRFTELLSSTLEAIRKDIAGVATKVEVLGTKLDQQDRDEPRRRAQSAPMSLPLLGPPPL